MIDPRTDVIDTIEVTLAELEFLSAALVYYQQQKQDRWDIESSFILSDKINAAMFGDDDE